MKKYFLILTIILSIAFSSCAAPNGGATGNQGAGDVANSKLTTEGLNDLRGVVGDDWGYAFVAGDCIFTDGGYYKFEDVLEYTFDRDGIALGERDERDVFFTRDATSLRGVYRTQYKNGVSTFYAFTAKYENPVVEYSYLGQFGYEEAFIGQAEIDDRIKLILIGDTLIAFDFLNGITVATQNVGDNLQYDFNYFQKQSSAVIFTLDGKTEIYTLALDYPSSRFERVTLSGDYSSSYDPAVIDGVYVFGGDEPTCASLGGGEFDRAQIIDEYTEYVEGLNDESLSDGEYVAWVENGVASIRTIEDDSVVTITATDVANGCAQVLTCVESRVGYTPEISAVKQLGDGYVYMVIEKEPDTFAGFRDVNDGIPPLVVRYDIQANSYTFCGLVDFTGYSVYLIVELL